MRFVRIFDLLSQRDFVDEVVNGADDVTLHDYFGATTLRSKMQSWVDERI